MFAKVYAQIFDSSIAEDYRVRLVFEDFLKLADKDGIVDMTRESIARRTNVPLEIVVHGITELEKPDPTSRTPKLDGRRIERLDDHRDWGWRIINFQKYRESASKEMLRMAEKERKQELRRRKKGFPPGPPNPKVQSTEAEAEAEPSRMCPGHVPDTSGQLRTETELPHGFPKTQEEAKAQASLAGCTEDCAIKAWNKAMSRNGLDAKGQPIRSFRHYLATEWAYQQERGVKESNYGKPARKPDPQIPSKWTDFQHQPNLPQVRGKEGGRS